MTLFQNRRLSKLFSSLRENASSDSTLPNRMFSSFRVKTSSKSAMRRSSFRTKSTSKSSIGSQSSPSKLQWHINPLYVSAERHSNDQVNQSSSSSGVSSSSSGSYFHSSHYDVSPSGTSSSGVFSDMSTSSLGTSDTFPVDPVNLLTPVIPTAYTKLRVVRRRISSNRSDTGLEIRIDD